MKNVRYAALAVEISEGEIPYDFLSPHLLEAVRYELIDDVVLIDIPKVARYAILDSAHIVVQAAGLVSEKTVEMYLEGLVLPVMALSAGMNLFHGSAVERDGKGLVMLGNKGSGKSTTAATLARSGCAVLCDDTVPISPNYYENARIRGPFVAPGIPRPMLLADAFLRIEGNPAACEARDTRDGPEKFAVNLPAGKKPVPLKAVFILSAGKTDRVEIKPLTGVHKVKAAMSHSLRLPSLHDPAVEFSRSLEMFRAVRVYSLTRPESGDSLDEVVRRILELSDAAD